MSYTQNNEEEVIMSYFKGRDGCVLSIGENDGRTFSNSLALIEDGWHAVLVEPADEAFNKMKALHDHNRVVVCCNVALSDIDGLVDFYSCGSHLGKGDSDLLSTISKTETERWGGTATFKQTRAMSLRWDSFMKQFPDGTVFNFISIDAEGYDLIILKQMNLRELGCEMICVEWNGKDEQEYTVIASAAGMKLIHKNAENLIFAL